MLFEVVTIDLHYMTDRHERFDLKISELKLRTARTKTLQQEAKTYQKFNFKVNYPFKGTSTTTTIILIKKFY